MNADITPHQPPSMVGPGTTNLLHRAINMFRDYIDKLLSRHAFIA